jgi:hypothetical protein
MIEPLNSMRTMKPSRPFVRTLLSASAILGSMSARADEGGVPFWFSGQYASMAAAAPTPGWTVTLLPYYYDGSADRSETFPRGNTLVTDVDSHLGLVNTQIAYAWDTKVLGGVPMIGLSWGAGNNGTSANLLATLPSADLEVTRSDSASGGTDLYPIATLSWSEGNDNWMAYVTGDIPTGAYNSQRLSNIGIGHGVIDAGGGYTYLNGKSGLEFSAVAGLTYNFKNQDTDYRNGLDAHLDWGLSQFLSESWEVGVAGYVYYQLTDDSYPTQGIIGGLRKQTLGGFKSRVAAAGPEVGYVFKMGKQSGYLNLRGYWEFWAQNRVEGYALFATVNLPLGD